MKNFFILVLSVILSFNGYSAIIWFAASYIVPSPTTGGAPGPDDGGEDFSAISGVCTLNSAAEINSINLSSSNQLIISGSVTINVVDHITISSGCTMTILSGSTVIIAGSITNNGSIIVQNGANLIQTGTGTASTGDYRISQSGSGNRNNYNFWSSPVNGASLPGVFSSANGCDFYYYNAANSEFRRLSAYSTCLPAVTADGSSTMTNGAGYIVAGGGSPSFNGTINTGTITNNTISSGWNLVGNPYPSSISGSEFLEINTNTTGTLYFWSDDGTAGGSYDETADYATWNAGGGTGASGGGASTIPNGSIAVGQGFFVSVSSGSSITFNNSMRGGSNSQFFKTNNEIIPRLWVSAEQNGFASSQILIAFSDSASEGEDWSYDSEKYAPNNKFTFGSILVGKSNPFAIQSFSKSDMETSREIPLFIRSEKSGVTVLQIDGVENWDSSLVISVKDNVTGKIQNLAQGPFSTYLNANEKYDTRFTLQINNPNGPPASVNDIDSSKLKLFYNDGSLTVANTIRMNSIEIYSISGVRVNSRSLNESRYTQISLNELPTGIYIGSVTLENGSTISKRFAVQ